MNNINLERYYDAIGISGWNKKTFLNKSRRKMLDCFWRMFAKEEEFHRGYINAYYKFEESKGRYGMDIVGDDEYKRIEETWNPINRHKILWWIANIPFYIECWLCCGWRLHYDKESKCWTSNDKYHMMTKLCRYGSPMWSEYEFTWWDKLRFKWITNRSLCLKKWQIDLMKCWTRRIFDMGIWKIIYTTESGYEGEVEVCAVNKFMAWDVFDDIAKDFDEKVIAADCFRVIEDEEAN